MLCDRLWEPQKKCEEHFADIDKFRIVFQLMPYPFELNVNNTVLTQELVNLLKLDRCNFKTHTWLQSQIDGFRKDESILSI